MGTYATLAQSNRTVQVPLPSTRGLIFDRHGVPLVTNVASYSVRIRPSDLPNPGAQEVVGMLATLVGLDPTDINVAIDSNPGSRFDLVRVAQDVEPDVASFIASRARTFPASRSSSRRGGLRARSAGLPGPRLHGAGQRARSSPNLRAAGYLPDDLIGRAGVEATYEAQLRGTYGLETVERDAAGRQVQVLRTDQQPVAGTPSSSRSMSTSSSYAQQAIQWGMRAAGLKRGVVIVMNPQNGEILAMVSLPTYDDNLFAEGISGQGVPGAAEQSGKPLVNHAISDQYPPGSTYKLVAGHRRARRPQDHARRARSRPPATSGSAASSSTTGTTPASGMCNIYCGFGHSSDTFFYQAAAMLGIDRLGYWAQAVRLRAPTGIDLPAEASGTVPTNQWKLDTLGLPIYPGEIYLAGIGQGYVAVTPLQLLNAYCALANGGTLYEPHVVGEIIGPDGKVVQGSSPRSSASSQLSPAVLRIMRQAARTGRRCRHTYNLVDLPIVVAGKTGTAAVRPPRREASCRSTPGSSASCPRTRTRRVRPERLQGRPAHRLRAGGARSRLRLADEGQCRHRDREVLPAAALRHQEGLSGTST